MVATILDRWLSIEVRTLIEQRFYARINQQARLETMSRDPEFMQTLSRHAGLFADHGVVHVRDVAQLFLKVLSTGVGLLIPPRDPLRLARMQGLGVLLAYFHDIGMVDFSNFGRAMHPEFAAQAVFDPSQDDILAAIWIENSGNLAWQLTGLAEAGKLPGDPFLILRELLTLSFGHSKSKLPVEVLNDPPRLRLWMQQAIRVDLLDLYYQQQAIQDQTVIEPDAGGGLAGSEMHQNPHLARFYTDVSAEAFTWLVDPCPEMQALMQDATDTVRVLRAADALRQRGTVLATSGSYQVFVDQHTGHAVYALRYGPDRQFLLEVPDPMSAGEANIASSEIDPGGDLRITFHRGTFSGTGAVDQGARSAALVVQDIQRDVIESFIRPWDEAGLQPVKLASQMQILLEETDDNPEFTQQVRQLLIVQAPQLKGRVRRVPSLKEVTPLERQRYQSAQPLNWPDALRQELLARLQASGHAADRIDPSRAFDHVRVFILEAGETLLEAGAPASLVYIPLDSGLKILPQGGYGSFMVQPWMPLGITGVIRGAERNATVIAERAVRLIVIPKMVYIRHWHKTLPPDVFRAAIAVLQARNPGSAGKGNLLEKSLLLQKMSFFYSLEQEALLEIAAQVQDVEVPAGQRVYLQGETGDCLFVVVDGTLQEERDGQAVDRLAAHDVFGEMAVLASSAHPTTVIASSDARLLRLNREIINRLLEENSLFARAVVKRLTRVIVEQTQSQEQTA